MIKILMIVGPTAVGKTALSIALAKQFNGEIISGDSMQIYRHLDVGTAKVTPAEQQGIPHHLIDIYNVQQQFTVAEFTKLAMQEITAINARGKLPMIVGGTGYYLQSLLAGYQFGGRNDAADPKYRQAITEQSQNESPEWLWEQLQASDPTAAAKIAPNNHVRLIRALEYQHSTGRLFSAQLDQQNGSLDPLIIGLNSDRQLVYQRINQRVDLMLQHGLIDEANWLFEQGGRSLPASKGIGYHELFPFFEHRIDLKTATEQIKLDSRHYAKRQLTWFRNKMHVSWFDSLQDDQATEEIKAKVTDWLTKTV